MAESRSHKLKSRQDLDSHALTLVAPEVSSWARCQPTCPVGGWEGGPSPRRCDPHVLAAAVAEEMAEGGPGSSASLATPGQRP